jgi:hypothetical protein
MNVNTKHLFQKDRSKDEYKLMDTKFILISNKLIEDASHIIAKQISLNKENSLIGLNIS